MGVRGGYIGAGPLVPGEDGRAAALPERWLKLGSFPNVVTPSLPLLEDEENLGNGVRPPRSYPRGT